MCACYQIYNGTHFVGELNWFEKFELITYFNDFDVKLLDRLFFSNIILCK